MKTTVLTDQHKQSEVKQMKMLYHFVFNIILLIQREGQYSTNKQDLSGGF